MGNSKGKDTWVHTQLGSVAVTQTTTLECSIEAVLLLSIVQFLTEKCEQWPGTRCVQACEVFQQCQVNCLQTLVESQKNLHCQNGIYHSSMASRSDWHTQCLQPDPDYSWKEREE